MVIYKYPLDLQSFNEVDMPRGAEVLSVQVQNGIVCLWALIDTRQPMETKRFQIVGTGEIIMDDTMHYIGTFQMPPYVWHVFEYTLTNP